MSTALGADRVAIAEGDTVICVDAGLQTGINTGETYIVHKVKKMGHSGKDDLLELKHRINAGNYYARRFKKVTDAQAAVTHHSKADKLITLINSQMRSPTREEIVKILQET